MGHIFNSARGASSAWVYLYTRCNPRVICVLWECSRVLGSYRSGRLMYIPRRRLLARCVRGVSFWGLRLVAVYEMGQPTAALLQKLNISQMHPLGAIVKRPTYRSGAGDILRSWAIFSVTRALWSYVTLLLARQFHIKELTQRQTWRMGDNVGYGMRPKTFGGLKRAFDPFRYVTFVLPNHEVTKPIPAEVREARPPKSVLLAHAAQITKQGLMGPSLLSPIGSGMG